MPADSLVKIRDLNFSYDNRPILNGINMDFLRGKVVAIMGGRAAARRRCCA